MADDAPDVFDYVNHREFLRDTYAARKASGRGFSYRSFALRAGLKSPNYLKLVIDGERNLTAEMAEQFAVALDLEGERTGYFVDLVALSRARGEVETKSCLERLARSRRHQRAELKEIPDDAKEEVTRAAADYARNWYVVAIRELVACSDFKEAPDWIAQRLVPSITPEEAARSVQSLLTLGLLARDSSGRLTQGPGQVEMRPGRDGLMVLHLGMLERARKALEIFKDGQECSVTGITLCVNAERVRDYVERIARFRRELHALEALEDSPNRVIQINFQLFPMTVRPPDE